MIYAGAIELSTSDAILLVLVVLMPLFLAILGVVLLGVGVRARRRSLDAGDRAGLPLIVIGSALVVPAVLIYGAALT